MTTKRIRCSVFFSNTFLVALPSNDCMELILVPTCCAIQYKHQTASYETNWFHTNRSAFLTPKNWQAWSLKSKDMLHFPSQRWYYSFCGLQLVALAQVPNFLTSWDVSSVHVWVLVVIFTAKINCYHIFAIIFSLQYISTAHFVRMVNLYDTL